MDVEHTQRMFEEEILALSRTSVRVEILQTQDNKDTDNTFAIVWHFSEDISGGVQSTEPITILENNPEEYIKRVSPMISEQIDQKLKEIGIIKVIQLDN